MASGGLNSMLARSGDLGIMPPQLENHCISSLTKGRAQSDLRETNAKGFDSTILAPLFQGVNNSGEVLIPLHVPAVKWVPLPIQVQGHHNSIYLALVKITLDGHAPPQASLNAIASLLFLKRQL